MIVPFPSHDDLGCGSHAATINSARREAKDVFFSFVRPLTPRILLPRKIAPIKLVRDIDKEANEWLNELATNFKPFNPRYEKMRSKRKAKLEVDDAWEVIVQSVVTKVPIGEENMMTRSQIMKTTRIGEKDKKQFLAFVLFAEITERPDVVTVYKDGKPHYFRAA